MKPTLFAAPLLNLPVLAVPAAGSANAGAAAGAESDAQAFARALDDARERAGGEAARGAAACEGERNCAAPHRAQGSESTGTRPPRERGDSASETEPADDRGRTTAPRHAAGRGSPRDAGRAADAQRSAPPARAKAAAATAPGDDALAVQAGETAEAARGSRRAGAAAADGVAIAATSGTAPEAETACLAATSCEGTPLATALAARLTTGQAGPTVHDKPAAENGTTTVGRPRGVRAAPAARGEDGAHGAPSAHAGETALADETRRRGGANEITDKLGLAALGASTAAPAAREGAFLPALLAGLAATPGVGGPSAAAPSSDRAPVHDAGLVSAPGSAGFADELGTQISVFVREGVQQARLHLNPQELGPVLVRIHLEGQAAQVHLAAEAAPTRQALERALPALAGQLSDAGFTLAGGGVFERPPQGFGAADKEAARSEPDPLASAHTRGAAASAPAARWSRPRGLVDLVA